MEVYAGAKDIYIMNLYKLSLVIGAFLIIVACTASDDAAPVKVNSQADAMSVAKEMSDAPNDCGINSAFKDAILKEGFIISGPENIIKTEIPLIADNIKSVKKVFVGNEDVFFTFDVLSRYFIKNNNNNVSGRFYCFQFKSSDFANSWFAVVDNAGKKSERHVIFSKPKKIMALAKNNVYLIEGYHISSYKKLTYIIDQLSGVEAVLGPNETVRM